MAKAKGSILDKPISRREFLIKGAAALAGLSAGAYAIKYLVDRKNPLDVTVTVPDKYTKEAYFYKKSGSKVTCQTCPHGCTLKEGELSVCRAKRNIGGKLYSLSYGNPCAVHVDPIEKKPLFHFYPGTTAFSIASAGCNFRCLNCQNYSISQKSPEETKNYELMPTDVVSQAKKFGAASVAYTYSEPTSFYEYMRDTSDVARKEGLYNVWVTNGYMNEKPLRALALDAANVDLKSYSDDIYQELNGGTLQPVLDTLKTLKDMGVWFEITNLVIPTYTDDLDMIKEMCGWIYKNLGPDYPLHLSRFAPLYKLTNLPQTPVSTLEDAHKVAKDAGIHHVYIDNVPNHEFANTFCPECGRKIVARRGYTIDENNIQDGACRFCGAKIAGRF